MADSTDLSKLITLSIYPKQKSRYYFSLILISLVIFLIAKGILDTPGSSGGVFVFILVALFFFILFIWLIYQAMYVNLMATALKVDALNFPDLLLLIEEVKAKLGFQQEVSVFIYPEVNDRSIVKRFFRSRYIILSSSLAEDFLKKKEKGELEFLVASHIAGLKAKQYDPSLLIEILEGIEDWKFLNIFLLPYARAKKYTGDNIGLLVNGNLENSLNALSRYFVGGGLSDQVGMAGIIRQKKYITGNFLAFMGRLWRSSPYGISRYINLLAYGKQLYPDQFKALTAKLDAVSILDFETASVPYEPLLGISSLIKEVEVPKVQSPINQEAPKVQDRKDSELPKEQNLSADSSTPATLPFLPPTPVPAKEKSLYQMPEFFITVLLGLVVIVVIFVSSSGSENEKPSHLSSADSAAIADSVAAVENQAKARAMADSVANAERQKTQ
jgi:hypothetical protein